MTIKTKNEISFNKEIIISNYEISIIKEINNKLGKIQTVRIIRWKYDCSLKQSLSIYDETTAE